jgi:hypothetical protein
MVRSAPSSAGTGKQHADRGPGLVVLPLDGVESQGTATPGQGAASGSSPAATVGQAGHRADQGRVVLAARFQEKPYQNLAAAGVGYLKLIDRDRVTLENLNRQILHASADLDRPKTESASEKSAP